MRYQGTRYPLGVGRRSRRTSWLGKQQGMNMQPNCYYILAQLVVVLLFVISISNHRSSRLDRWVYNSRDMINTQTAILLSDFRQHDWQLICSSVHSFVNNLDPHGTLRGAEGRQGWFLRSELADRCLDLAPQLIESPIPSVRTSISLCDPRPILEVS